jgi:hypothetical protein
MQDVISLCLDDIDWADGRVDLQPGKTHRARSLPLPQESARPWSPTCKVAARRGRSARSFCAVGPRFIR